MIEKGAISSATVTTDLFLDLALDLVEPAGVGRCSDR